MLAAARGGRRLLTRLSKASPAVKQAHVATLFTYTFPKVERRWLLQPPSLPLPNLDPFPFLRRLTALSHSTLGDEDLADHVHQDEVDPVSLVAGELASLASNLRMRVTADILNVPSLASAAEYFFKLGVEGKRFRPMVLMLMASSLSLLPSPKLDLKFGVDDRRIRQHRVAEITELIHYIEMVKYGVGEESMEYYLQKTYMKTASLMANSCKSIALLADQPREVAMHAFDYGRHLGLAYQLVDDALDFTGTSATLGKPALSDLREGIATAPILFALQEELLMQMLIDRKFSEAGDSRMAVKLVNKARGVAKTLDLAAKHAQLAESAIAQFPPAQTLRLNNAVKR